MSHEEQTLRQAIIDGCLAMNAKGLNQGTSGNISVRHRDRMLITPSATAYQNMTPEMIAAMPFDGAYGAFDGPAQPSTEWRFHFDILRARPDAGAVVHLHSPFASVLAIARKSIPACHYMIAAFGGHDVRCADYALFGTKELSCAALSALNGRKACLLANHGMITVDETLEKALWLAVELETIAHQYYHALLLGDPVILSKIQIEETLAKFKNYGLKVQIT